MSLLRNIFWNWSDECCWRYIYNWVNINAKILGLFCPILWKTSLRYIKWISLVSERIQALEFFAQNAFFRHLEIFRLDIGQISFNLVKKASATWQLAFLLLSITFYNILAQACVQIKILRQESDLRLSRLGFCIFKIFFLLFHFPLFFSFCCSDWPSNGLACS